jgi:TPR repeat protein
LGILYAQEDDNTPADLKKSIRYLRQAVELGDAMACFYLAKAFGDGEGVNQSFVEATKLYKMSAERGYIEAYAEVGFNFLRGIGTKEDEEKGCEWIEKGFKAGAASGYYAMYVLYTNGECGHEKDEAKAAKLLAKAVAMGNSSAIASQQVIARGKAADAKEKARQEAASRDAVSDAVANAIAAERAERANTAAEEADNYSEGATVTLNGLVSYLKKDAPKSGFRKILEEGKIAAGAYSYDFRMTGKLLIVLIIPYSVTQHTPYVNAAHYDYSGVNDYSYKSDYTDVTHYTNMTMIKMKIMPEIGSERKYNITLTDGGYFMVLGDR